MSATLTDLASSTAETDSSRPTVARQEILDAVFALSLANLLFITSWARLFSDTDYGFYNKLPVLKPTLLALAVNIVGFAFIIWLIIRARRCSRNRPVQILIDGMLLVSLVVPGLFLRALIDPHHKINPYLHQPVGLAIAAILGMGALWKVRWVIRVASAFVAILFPLAAFNFVRISLLLLGILHLRGGFYEPPPPPLLPVDAGRPRVLWIIFDELDYRLVFEQRPPGVHMPEMDRLRTESLCATNAYSPVGKTRLSMPSLITGQRCSNISFTNTPDLAITLADSGRVVGWKTLQSVFSAARDLGFNTALVGWHIPYSRILGMDLNYCAWYPNPGFEPTRAPTFGAALVRQISCLVASIHLQREVVELHRDALKESLSLVTNRTYGLTLLHLFPPHLPGIYVPAKDSYSLLGQLEPGGYLNNLALVDRDLGKLRTVMTRSELWDKTWLIVSADHSWRTSMCYDGKQDNRIPFLVKPPGNPSATTYPGEFNTVCTHDLILAILQGKLQNQSDVAAWLDANASKHPFVEAPTNVTE